MVYIEKKGYFLKRNKKELTKTYFILRECFLFWSDEKTGEVKGAVSLARSQVFSSDASFLPHSSDQARLTVFIVAPDGERLELVAESIVMKEEWISAIRLSCEYVMQFFDGANSLGFNQNHNGAENQAPIHKDGWFRFNGRKVFCVVHEGILVWYNEEPSSGPVEADRVRGCINLACCGFALSDELVDTKKKEQRERDQKEQAKEKEVSIVILPPLGLSYYVFTLKNPDEVGRWMDALASNSGFRSVPQPSSLSNKQHEERALRKAGWLSKKTKDGKTRWHVVQSDVLMWFDKEQSAESTRDCRGNIMLGSGSYVGRDYTPDGGAGEDSGSFVVYSPVDGAFKLSAKTKGDADEWIYIISECINLNNKAMLQLTRTAKEKTGWMSKRGKRMWFCLKNNHLMWYADEQVDGRTSLVKGSMMVEGLVVQQGRNYTLTLSSNSSDELVLTLNDDDDCEEWILAIKNAQLFIQQEHQRHITLSDKYFNEFMEFLVRGKSMAVLMALCRCYESEQLIATITALCLSEDRHGPLLSAALQREIDACASEATLFRTDSIATKTTRAYFRLIGSEYLHSTLFHLVTEVVNNPEGYEVDPTKATPNDDIVANSMILRYAAQRFLDQVVHSITYLPIQMRQFFASVRAMVSKKYPDSQVKAVGSFLFLRFLCPSIFSPDGFGLVADSPSDKARRALVLIAKLLQNTANGVQFGGKEEYMAPLNDFVTENINILYGFLDQASQPFNIPPTLPQREQSRQEIKRVRDEKAKHLAVIVRNLNASIEYLQKELSKDDMKRLKNLLNEKEPVAEVDDDFFHSDLPPPPEDAFVPPMAPPALPPPPPPLTLRRNMLNAHPVPNNSQSLPPPPSSLPPRPKMNLATAIQGKLAARNNNSNSNSNSNNNSSNNAYGPAAVPTVIPTGIALHHPPTTSSSPTAGDSPSGKKKKGSSKVLSDDASSSPPSPSGSAFIPNLFRTIRKSSYYAPVNPDEEQDISQSPKSPKGKDKEKDRDKDKRTMTKAQSLAEMKRDVRKSYSSLADIALSDEALQKHRLSLLNAQAPPRSPNTPTYPVALSPSLSSPSLTSNIPPRRPPPPGPVLSPPNTPPTHSPALTPTLRSPHVLSPQLPPPVSKPVVKPPPPSRALSPPPSRALSPPRHVPPSTPLPPTPKPIPSGPLPPPPMTVPAPLSPPPSVPLPPPPIQTPPISLTQSAPASTPPKPPGKKPPQPLSRSISSPSNPPAAPPSRPPPTPPALSPPSSAPTSPNPTSSSSGPPRRAPPAPPPEPSPSSSSSLPSSPISSPTSPVSPAPYVPPRSQPPGPGARNLPSRPKSAMFSPVVPPSEYSSSLSLSSSSSPSYPPPPPPSYANGAYPPPPIAHAKLSPKSRRVSVQTTVSPHLF